MTQIAIVIQRLDAPRFDHDAGFAGDRREGLDDVRRTREAAARVEISVDVHAAAPRGEAIRDRIFHPFVSYGKENGTGLGLAVVQKIVQDHGGEILVERTAGMTVFRIALPNRVPHGSGEMAETSVTEPPFVPAQQAEPNENLLSHPGS